MKKDKPTIRDIAREANVSVATVSRVINKSFGVKEETRLKIENIIESNNYKPNELARSLYTKKSRTIGVILPDITSNFFAKAFLEIQKSALHHGKGVLLCNTLNDYGLGNYYIGKLVEKQVEGIIYLGGSVNQTITDPQFVKCLNREMNSIPLVVINGKIDNYSYTSIYSDEYDAIWQLTRYLVSLGHKKLALLGGKTGITSTDIKIKAFRDAAPQLGYVLRDEWIFQDSSENSFDFASGVNVMEKLLDRGELPTAIIAINDETACGIISACINRGYKVPEDFSIVGFDNSIFAKVSVPPVTTIAHQYEELGQIAVRMINDLIDRKEIKERHVPLRMKLIERASCRDISR